MEQNGDHEIATKNEGSVSQIANRDTAADMTSETRKPKKGKGLVVGMVLCAILAIGGIGFGAYEFLQGQQKDNDISKLNTEIESANGKIAELESLGTSNSESAESSSTNVRKANPVIKGDGTEEYTLGFGTSAAEQDNNGLWTITLSVYNGDVKSCEIGLEKNSGVVGSETKPVRSCKVNGLTGKIYKVVQVGEGQDASGDSVAFIMEDGSVEYFSLDNIIKGSEFNVGKMKIDGFVVDVIDVSVGEGGYSGGGSTIFVFANGDYVKYDKSMLK